MTTKSKKVFIFGMAALCVCAVLCAVIIPLIVFRKKDGKPYFIGSFLQPWLAVGWDDAHWETELRMLKDLGMEYLIVQQLVTKNATADGENENTGSAYYPTAIDEFRGYYNPHDFLGKCLKGCKKTGMKLILGTYSDDDWYDFGWVWSETSYDGSGPSKTAFQEYMTRTADITNRVINEIIGLYGGEYGDVIHAWYYVPELWNLSLLEDNGDRAFYIKTFAEGLNRILAHCTSTTPGKPMMLSPFVNTTLIGATPAQLQSQWEEIIEAVDFRGGDIIAPQDSVGAGGMPFDDGGAMLKEWSKAYFDAVAASDKQIRLWANNESFLSGEDGKGYSCEASRLISQMEITSKYSEANVVFAYSHYYSPHSTDPNTGELIDPRFHEAYEAYLESAKQS